MRIPRHILDELVEALRGVLPPTFTGSVTIKLVFHDGKASKTGATIDRWTTWNEFMRMCHERPVASLDVLDEANLLEAERIWDISKGEA